MHPQTSGKLEWHPRVLAGSRAVRFGKRARSPKVPFEGDLRMMALPALGSRLDETPSGRREVQARTVG